MFYSNINNGGYGINLGITDLTLPSTLTTICSRFLIYTCELKTVTCNAVTPPVIYNNGNIGTWGNNHTTLTNIYVPAASVNAYKASPSWSNHASIISAIPT